MFNQLRVNPKGKYEGISKHGLTFPSLDIPGSCSRSGALTQSHIEEGRS